jgi:WhiB family redox-sensing transcriptional regulator
MDWRHRGSCRDEDPELFFPAPKEVRKLAEARSVCETCPVVAECLKWALDNGQIDGVWGGLSEDELRAHPDRKGQTGGIEAYVECRRCLKMLPAERFGRDRNRSSGRKARCGKCVYESEVGRRARRKAELQESLFVS